MRILCPPSGGNPGPLPGWALGSCWVLIQGPEFLHLVAQSLGSHGSSQLSQPRWLRSSHVRPYLVLVHLLPFEEVLRSRKQSPAFLPFPHHLHSLLSSEKPAPPVLLIPSHRFFTASIHLGKSRFESHFLVKPTRQYRNIEKKNTLKYFKNTFKIL